MSFSYQDTSADIGEMMDVWDEFSEILVTFVESSIHNRDFQGIPALINLCVEEFRKSLVQMVEPMLKPLREKLGKSIPELILLEGFQRGVNKKRPISWEDLVTGSPKTTLIYVEVFSFFISNFFGAIVANNTRLASAWK